MLMEMEQLTSLILSLQQDHLVKLVLESWEV